MHTENGNGSSFVFPSDSTTGTVEWRWDGLLWRESDPDESSEAKR
jgi:hypothetical protein